MPRLKEVPPFVRTFALAILPLGLGAIALLSSDLAESPGHPKAGRDIFVKNGCMRCHSVWRSDNKKGPALASLGMGRNLYDLCASIWTHWARMNEVRERAKERPISLSSRQFRDIVAYLYYLNYSAQPGDPRLGEKIFREKECIQCHAIEPLHAKDKPARAVYEMREFQGAVPLAVAVWNHGAEMYQIMSARQIRWPEFQGEEVAHLVEFIRSRTGAPEEEPMEVPGDPARGRVLFSSKSCKMCHTPGVVGPQKGPDLAASGVSASLSSLIANLWNHYPRMSGAMAENPTAYPRIAQDEMEHILAYVYWLKAFGLEGNAAEGRALYHSKKCDECHASSPDHAAVAPNLLQSEATESVYALLAAIWNHGPQMESLLRERNITWPALTGEEMRNLVAFFRRSKPETTGRAQPR